VKRNGQERNPLPLGFSLEPNPEWQRLGAVGASSSEEADERALFDKLREFAHLAIEVRSQLPLRSATSLDYSNCSDMGSPPSSYRSRAQLSPSRRRWRGWRGLAVIPRVDACFLLCSLKPGRPGHGDQPSQASRTPSEEDNLYIQVVINRRIFHEIRKEVQKICTLGEKTVAS
jgi:hypothetical protein